MADPSLYKAKRDFYMALARLLTELKSSGVVDPYVEVDRFYRQQVIGLVEFETAMKTARAVK